MYVKRATACLQAVRECVLLLESRAGDSAIHDLHLHTACKQAVARMTQDKGVTQDKDALHQEEKVPRTVDLLGAVDLLRDDFDEFQFEAERGGDGLQVGKPDVFALLDVADGGLIGNASPFG